MKGKIQVIHIWCEARYIGDPEHIKNFLQDLVTAIDMTPHREPIITIYPTEELGFTANQPIAMEAIQHLHESYIVFDNWIEFDPAYANIIVNSCKDYNTHKIREMIFQHFPQVFIKWEDSIYYTGEMSDLGKDIL